MTCGVSVVNRMRNDFGMYPMGINRANLSAKAKHIAMYLFGLRDKFLPYVSQIERETGYGRDARQAAFRELQDFGMLVWDEVRERGRIVRRTCVLNWDVFVAVPEDSEPVDNPDPEPGPENPAPVKNKGTTPEPENPAPVEPTGTGKTGSGESGPVQPEIRSPATGKSGPSIREKEKKGARDERSRIGGRLLRSRGETAQPPARPDPKPIPDESRDQTREERADVARRLGLPYRDPETGEWRRDHNPDPEGEPDRSRS